MTRCTVCMAKFGLFNKEDSCRRCGHFVCSKCSSAKVSLKGHEKPVRVCKPCIDILKEQEERREQQHQQQQRQAQHAQMGGVAPGQHVQPQPGAPAPHGPPPRYSDIEHLPRWYRRQVFPNVVEEEVRVAEYPEPQPEVSQADESGLPRWLATQRVQAQQPQPTPSAPGTAPQQQCPGSQGRQPAKGAGGSGPKATASQHDVPQPGDTVSEDNDDLAAVLQDLSVPAHEPALPSDTEEAGSSEANGDGKDKPTSSPTSANKSHTGHTAQRGHDSSLSDLRAHHERIFGKRDSASTAGVSPSRLAEKYKSIFGADPTKKVPREELLARFKKVTGRHIDDQGAGITRARQWPKNVEAMSDDDLANMLVQEARDQISLEGGDAAGHEDDDHAAESEGNSNGDGWDETDGPVDEEEKRRINALTKKLIAQAEQKAEGRSNSAADASGYGGTNTTLRPSKEEGGADDLSAVLADLQREHDSALRDLSHENVQKLLQDANTAIQRARQEDEEEEEQEQEGDGAEDDVAPDESKQMQDGGAVPSTTSRGEDGDKETPPHCYEDQEALYQALRQHPLIWPFLQPLDKTVVPEFFTAVQDPLDMREVRQRMDSGAYKDRQQLRGALHKMLEDAVRFHGASSVFGRYALTLQAHLDAQPR